MDQAIADSAEPTADHEAVGICLSGGGLRAAAFGTGALQALDEQLSLLRGPNSARYLSAVSGGSYIAGAFTLVNAGSAVRRTDGQPFADITDLPDGRRPFERGSVEEGHLVRHCRYLIEEGSLLTSLRLVGLMLAGIASTCIAFAWFGAVAIGGAAFVSPYVLPSGGTPGGGLAWVQWLIAAGYLTACLVGVVGFIVWGADTRPKSAENVLVAAGFVLAWTAPSFAARLRSVAPLSEPAWWAHQYLNMAIGLACAVVLSLVLIGLGRRKAGLAIPLTIASISPVLLALLTVTWVGAAVVTQLENAHGGYWVPVGLAASAVIAYLLSRSLPTRASPHRPYRDMLAKCFAVTRGNPTAAGYGTAAVRQPIDAIALSSLAPPEDGSAPRFPELLICAAANVSDKGASPAGTNVVPLIITPSAMFVPEAADASIPMTELEKLTTPARILPGQREPMMSLMTAIAITGAAVAPTMGRMSITQLRRLLTVLNIRLGVWLPNPMNTEARKAVATEPRWSMSGIGLFVLEFIGFHSSRSRTIYASDGGHYENLGLVELVRRNCKVIWCIDSSGGPPGANGSLAQSLLLAETVTGARIDIDIDKLGKSSDAPRGVPRIQESSTIGSVYFENGSMGQLIVIKLGLTEASPSSVREYQKTDRKFPHHSTANQTFRAERFVAYQRLGWHSTTQAITAFAAAPPPA